MCLMELPFHATAIEDLAPIPRAMLADDRGGIRAARGNNGIAASPTTSKSSTTNSRARHKSEGEWPEPC
jgi:hypothetical protein